MFDFYPIMMYGYASDTHELSGMHFSGKSLEDAKANVRFFLSQKEDGSLPAFKDDIPPQDVLDVWTMGRKRHA